MEKEKDREAKKSTFKGFKMWEIGVLAFLLLFIATSILMTTPLGGRLYFQLSHDSSKIEKVEEGSLYQQDEDSIGRLLKANGTVARYAPRPMEFRGAKCASTSLAEVTELPANSWSLPALEISSNFREVSESPSGFIELPAAPEGAYYTPSAPLGSDEGASLIAGHVDYEEEDKLSPYGLMSKATPCLRVYVADSEGKISEYALTDLYVVDQNELREESAIFSLIGDPSLFILTCSGPSVGDTGGIFRFNYEDNLIAGFKKIA